LRAGVDDHRLLRQELRNILSLHREFTVVGEAADGAHAYQLSNQLQPDVILVDLHRPNINGIEAMRRIKTRLPQVIIIGLSVNTSVAAAAEMNAAGASPYMGKDTAPENLYKSIHSALSKVKGGLSLPHATSDDDPGLEENERHSQKLAGAACRFQKESSGLFRF